GEWHGEPLPKGVYKRPHIVTQRFPFTKVKYRSCCCFHPLMARNAGMSYHAYPNL
ncbi:unnamed protein product, partial [Aphanomyces euteiches]